MIRGHSADSQRHVLIVAELDVVGHEEIQVAVPVDAEPRLAATFSREAAHQHAGQHGQSEIEVAPHEKALRRASVFIVSDVPCSITHFLRR